MRGLDRWIRSKPCLGFQTLLVIGQPGRVAESGSSIEMRNNHFYVTDKELDSFFEFRDEHNRFEAKEKVSVFLFRFSSCILASYCGKVAPYC